MSRRRTGPDVKGFIFLAFGIVLPIIVLFGRSVGWA